MRFRVERVIELRGDVTVFVRTLDEGDFILSETPRLGGVEIRRQVLQPRALTGEGKPDLTIFAFQLVTASDRRRLSDGQTVDLA